MIRFVPFRPRVAGPLMNALSLFALSVLVALATSPAQADVAPMLCRKGQTRIMPLGDSITNGAGWRIYLQDLLKADGYTFRMVGGRNDPLQPEGVWSDHGGSAGWTIGSFPYSQEFGGADVDWIGSRPELILLMIGANDMQWGQAQGAPERLGELLDKIWHDLPQVTIFVAQITPFQVGGRVNDQPNGALINPMVDAYNAAIPAVVAKRVAAGKRAVVVDQHKGFDPATDLKDKVHPNESGHHKIAARWMEAIRQYTLARPAYPDRVLPPLVSATVNGSRRVVVEPGEAVTLHGAMDDPGGVGLRPAIGWRKVGGPEGMTLVQPGLADTTATFTAAGSYALAFVGANGARSGHDIVRVVVRKAGAPGDEITPPAPETLGRSLGVSIGTQLRAADAAGVIPRERWNPIAVKESSPVTISGLTDDTGAKTTLAYSFRGNNPVPATNPDTPDTPDGRLLAGRYATLNPANNYLRNIPYAQYDLYLYFHQAAGTAPDDSEFVHSFMIRDTDSERILAGPLYARNQPGPFTGWTRAATTQITDQKLATPAANYLLLPNLTAPNLDIYTGSLDDAWSKTGHVATSLCGVQIVESGLTPGAPRPASATIPGDMDGNGVINIQDIILTLRSAVGLTTPSLDQMLAGDLNGDGKINVADTLLLLRKIVGVSLVTATVETPLPTPGMGWSTYNFFVGAHNERLMRLTADAFIASGLRDAGYTTLRIDGGWWGDDGSQRWWYWSDSGQYPNGTAWRPGDPHVDPKNYPGGLLPVAEYLHARGLKLGFYLSPSLSMGLPGNHPRNQAAEVPAPVKGLTLVAQHAQFVADSGVDHLFYDGYDWNESQGIEPYTRMFQALRENARRVNRPIAFSINTGWHPQPREWADEWRTSPDISGAWDSIMQNLGSVASPGAAGGGHWSNPDYLMTGFIGDNEALAQMSLWCVVAAPLYLSHDFRVMNDWDRYVLLNTEAIAVDQDPKGQPGRRVRSDANSQIWTRPLVDGSTAVVLLNTSSQPRDLRVNWSDLGLTMATGQVRDLWAHRSMGAFADGYTAAQAPPHGAVMLKVRFSATPIPEPDPTWAPRPAPKPTFTPLASTGWALKTTLPRHDDPLSHLLDGDPKTGFWSYASPGQTLELDTGRVQPMDRMVMDHKGIGPNPWPYTVYAARSTFRLEVSSDGKTWAKVAEESFGTSYTLVRFPRVSARYVRMTILSMEKTSAYQGDPIWSASDLYLFDTQGAARG